MFCEDMPLVCKERLMESSAWQRLYYLKAARSDRFELRVTHLSSFLVLSPNIYGVTPSASRSFRLAMEEWGCSRLSWPSLCYQLVYPYGLSL